MTGGSSGSTEQNTFNKWDYRAKDDFFSRLDEATQSTVTTRSGADAEGNPSLSQSIVNLREYDFYSQSVDDEPYGGYTRYEQRTTQRNREASRDAQTASVSGPSDERRQNLAIDHAFESLDETGVSYLWEVDDLDEGDTYSLDERDSYSRTEKSDSSNYRSTHLVDENGLARDGEFTATSRSTVTSTDPKYFDPQRGSFSRVYSYEYFGPEYYGGEQYSIAETEETAGLQSQVTTTTSESGSYYDVGLSSTYAFRVQTGDYKIDQRSQLDDFYTFDYFYHEDFGISGWSTTDIDSTDQKRDASQSVTTGEYGTWGIEEQREFRDTYAEELYVQDLRRNNAGWTDTYERYEVLINNDNGVFSGREHHRYWGEGDPTVWDPIDEENVPSYDHVVTDEDYFGGSPPSGPAPVGSYVVYAQRDEQTEEDDLFGGIYGENNSFRPGTIDAELDAAEFSKLQPLFDERDFLPSADESLQRHRLEQILTGEHLNTPSAPLFYFDGTMEESQREAAKLPKICNIEQLGSGLGVGTKIFGEGPILSWNPKTWLPAAGRSIVDTALPGAAPSYLVTYEDGTQKIFLGGEPSTGDGLNLATLPLGFKVIKGAKPVKVAPKARFINIPGVGNLDLSKSGIDGLLARNSKRINQKLGRKLGKADGLPFPRSKEGFDQAREAVRNTLENATDVTPAFKNRAGDTVFDVYSRQTGMTVRLREDGIFDTLIPGATKPVRP